MKNIHVASAAQEQRLPAGHYVLTWKQRQPRWALCTYLKLQSETPPCADIHLHVVGELARKLGQFAVDIAVLAGFDRTA